MNAEIFTSFLEIQRMITIRAMKFNRFKQIILFVKTRRTNLAKELDSQISPNVQSCLAVAAATTGPLPKRIEEAICILGSTLGRFDLDGQLTGLESVRNYCRTQLEEMANGRDVRLRSYQTLGMCTGAALAILFV